MPGGYVSHWSQERRAGKEARSLLLPEPHAGAVTGAADELNAGGLKRILQAHYGRHGTTDVAALSFQSLYGSHSDTRLFG